MIWHTEASWSTELSHAHNPSNKGFIFSEEGSHHVEKDYTLGQA